MSGVGAPLALLVSKVSLRGERIDPSTDHVRRDCVIHEHVGDASPVAVLSDMHVNLVSQNLEANCVK